MKLWKIHPKYLDDKELLDLFKHALIVKDILSGKLLAYRTNKYVSIFKERGNPILAIDAFLYQIYIEIKKRGYHQDHSNIRKVSIIEKINIKKEDIDEEYNEFLKLIKERNVEKYQSIRKEIEISPNPVFNVVY